MVTRKRDEPQTPDQHRMPQASKKAKGYASPLPKTPLRNVMTPERNGKGPVVHSSSQRPAAEVIGAGLMSASRSRLASTSAELLNPADSEDSGRRPEELAARHRRNRKAELMSPVVGSSPKAALPQALSGSKLGVRKGSTVSTASGSTPVASVIAGEAANRPLPGSNGKASKMTAEQMSRVFEEWIKIAADNKINAKNTWNLALIDYFSELSFVRDGASINFQKASCTLDGCVKIYSSRVDSVVDETSKLLNGLADGHFRPGRHGQEDEGDVNAGEGDEEEAGQRKRQARKASRHVSTLERNPEALCLKQFDLEHAVDPLFRKTCAEFDESSSRGSLMHNLSISASCQVVFDSADATRLGDACERMATGGQIGLGAFRKAIGSTTLASVGDRRLCAPFAEYSLADGRGSRLAEEQMAKAMERLAKMNIAQIGSTAAGGPAPMELDGQVFDAAVDSGPEDDYGPLMDDDYGAETAMPFSDGLEEGTIEAEAYGTTTTTVQQPGFTRNSDGLDNMFSYFDDSVKQQAWAGPNHWKVRRPTFIRPASNGTQTDPARKTGTRQRKDFSLDFDEQAEDVDVEALFAKPANAATITLTKAQIEERALKDNLLPEDLHFSSINFLRLFTKPSWRFGASQTVTTRQLRPRTAEQAPFDPAQEQPEIEGDFWAVNAHPEGVADANYGTNTFCMTCRY